MLYKMMCCTFIAFTAAAPASLPMRQGVFLQEPELPFQKPAVHAMSILQATEGTHATRTATYAKLHELANARKSALAAYENALKASKVGAQQDVDHGSSSADYKKLYEEAQARYEQQKKDCLSCDAAEVKLISALSSAKDKHADSQTASEGLAAAIKAYSDAKSAWEDQKDAYAQEEKTLNCGGLTVKSDKPAFENVIAITTKLMGLAEDETKLEGTMNDKKKMMDEAQANYDSAKAGADAFDKQVTDLTEKRDIACAGLTGIAPTPTPTEWTIGMPETTFQIIAGATWEFTNNWDCGGADLSSHGRPSWNKGDGLTETIVNSRKECAEWCLEKPTCVAFNYPDPGNGNCWTKNDDNRQISTYLGKTCGVKNDAWDYYTLIKDKQCSGDTCV
jgi:tetratricopeptide (TPR) repeat protein